MDLHKISVNIYANVSCIIRMFYSWSHLIHFHVFGKNQLWSTQITKFMGPTWGPPGSCRPQMGPMLAPWTLLLEQVMAWCRRVGDKSLHEPMMTQFTGTYMLLGLDDWSRWYRLYISCLACEVYTVMSLLEAPYLIEAPPNGSTICHKIVAPPQNRSARRF